MSTRSSAMSPFMRPSMLCSLSNDLSNTNWQILFKSSSSFRLVKSFILCASNNNAKMGILAEIGLNQLKAMYCLDVSKVNGCVRRVRIDSKRKQNFGRLNHSGAHTLSIHEQNEPVEAEHFDYFLLKVVRLVCGLLGDQLVDNVEQTLSQLDHVTSLLFWRVGDQRGDKVPKAHQIVRVHTFGNEYFDCLESVSEQRAASALASNTVQNSLEHFESMKQLHIVPVTQQQLVEFLVQTATYFGRALVPNVQIAHQTLKRLGIVHTAHLFAIVVANSQRKCQIKHVTIDERFFSLVQHGQQLIAVHSLHFFVYVDDTGETLDGGVHELDIGCHGNQCKQKAGAAQTLHTLAHRHRLKHPHAHIADHYAAHRPGRALQLHGRVRQHSQRRHTLIARYVQLFANGLAVVFVVDAAKICQCHFEHFARMHAEHNFFLGNELARAF
ncbi:hypothetical protein BpHYR1_005991 [Brachionus plicatilis]|uniref:Uncharacterized protein n=1 Tax=Brachionus plicatilis TaxID=10195 RepID=A0A3M7SWZ5_BRAPC|nr:hypothetical protein BpHYR1_005991 [Brachionus plicatilis]